jgi:hypothetical protein
MRWVLALTLASCTALLPAETAKSKPQTSSASAKKKPSAKPSATTAHAAVHSSHTRRSRTRHTAHSGPSYQLHPDVARYAEIQKALADRGYFKGEADGKWGDDSVDALKRFQADQKLDNTGKIDSLTLIGLGLGPKHDGSLAPSGAGSPSTPFVPPPEPTEEPAPAPASPPVTPK